MMAARPRTRATGNWLENLQPRAGYYTWRDPRAGKTHVIGRFPLAKFQAIEANAQIPALPKSLIERVQNAAKTMADLLGKMPTEGIAEIHSQITHVAGQEGARPWGRSTAQNSR